MKNLWARLCTVLMSFILPSLAFAEETFSEAVSFSPPPSDISVTFLENIFGVVDGVLHGTGSQIMGEMFSVFNAAVLALGGIVIMYIILVSTMNTAHEGQMLGQKWSSIWVPVRATMGLALLIPKASGYCMMQIFVMWVVVQGIGVADKVWGAALDYLNRGGVIVKANMAPDISATAGGGSIGQGAATMLYGQVCMAGLQAQLERQRNTYLDAKENDAGRCYGDIDSDPDMKSFCEDSVPDFINSVDPMVAFNKDEGSADIDAMMPSIHDGSVYEKLNGVCGTISWSPMAQDFIDKLQLPDGVSRPGGGGDAPDKSGPPTKKWKKAGKSIKKTTNKATKTIKKGIQNNFNPGEKFDTSDVKSEGKELNTDMSDKRVGGSIRSLDAPKAPSNKLNFSKADVDIIKRSRAAAVTQMYLTLSTTARQMVSNDPQLNGNGISDGDASAVADSQFGVPEKSSYSFCKDSSEDCPLWGQDDFSTAPVLLGGAEFQDAIADYNAVMAPALKLQNEMKNQSQAESERSFITDAKERGWITAGSYFYDLARLNGSGNASTRTDQNSGLGDSTYKPSDLTDSFNDDNSCNEKAKYAVLCDLFSKDDTKLRQVNALITGEGVAPSKLTPLTKQDFNGTNTIDSEKGIGSTTVYGFVTNGMVIDLPGQEGLSGISMKVDIDLDWSTYDSLDLKAFPEYNFKCNKSTLWTGCLAKPVISFVNDFFNVFLSWMVMVLENIAKLFYKAFVVLPLEGFTYIFIQGMQAISSSGTNPIIGLAKMGSTYVNFAMDAWIVALGLQLLTLIPPLGPFLLGFISLLMPFFLSWLAMMLSIGFITAYFVPFYPYMIFTFGSIAWIIAVIEAMVAAPIVALGIAHPEGHDALGKSEQGIMILLNVFLRPAMMIIGYIAGIALCFVSIWIMNAGFEQVLSYLKSDNIWAAPSTSAITTITWSALFGYFFGAVMYTMLYVTLATKAFTLIAVLPDKVLRWIGGQAESTGQETMQWAEESKSKIGEAGQKTDRAMTQAGQRAGGEAMKGAKAIKDKIPSSDTPNIDAQGTPGQE